MGIANTVLDAISALALCHNVTPVKENEEDLIPVSYQASSPDEVALVKFSERVGLILSNRSFTSITLTNPLLQTEVLSPPPSLFPLLPSSPPPLLPSSLFYSLFLIKIN